MKKALGVVGLLAIAFAGYRYAAAGGPEGRYKLFAEEVLHRRYDAAAGMADGLSAGDLEKVGTQEHIGAGPQMFQTLFPSRYRIESSETTPSGDVTLHAVQTVLFNPEGVESAVRPAMFATMKQVVTLRKRADGWRVVSFTNTFEKMDTLSRR